MFGYVAGGLALIAGIVAAALFAQLQRARKAVMQYEQIADLDRRYQECQSVISKALDEKVQALDEVIQCKDMVAKLEEQIAQYQQIVKQFKTAADLQRHINQLSQFADGCKTLADIKKRIADREKALEDQASKLQKMGYAYNVASGFGNIQKQIEDKQKALIALQEQILAIEDAGDIQKFGFYKTRYEFDTSEQYFQKYEAIREEQKQLIKSHTAAAYAAETLPDGSKAPDKPEINHRIQLVLRAFNGECDAAVAKVRYDNVLALEERINKAYEQLNNVAEANQISISPKFLELKLQELRLAHEFKQKKQAEEEEHLRAREELKENEEVDRELRQAVEDAEREETLRRNAFEEAQADLKMKTGEERDQQYALVADYEHAYEEARTRRKKAAEKAENLYSGHLYILSNIGSFGDGVFKIGITRRFEPLEKIKKIGADLVPFDFDVHTLVFSENVFELEKKLHDHFASHRVNLADARRGFFRATIQEVREAVSRFCKDATFATVAEAEQFRKTVAIQRQAAEAGEGDQGSKTAPAKDTAGACGLQKPSTKGEASGIHSRSGIHSGKRPPG